MSVVTARLAQLYAGLALYGLSLALMVRADLGLDPWDVLHQGTSHRAGLSFGLVVNLVAVAVLVLWIPLRQRPGPGTVSNVLLVGTVADVALGAIPAVEGPVLRPVVLVAGIVLNGVATAAYVGAGLGPGPRDGLMTGLAVRTGVRVGRVRTGIEGTVLVAGWALGGAVGVGTVAYALAIGPLVQRLLPVFARAGDGSRAGCGGGVAAGPVVRPGGSRVGSDSPSEHDPADVPAGGDVSDPVPDRTRLVSPIRHGPRGTRSGSWS